MRALMDLGADIKKATDNGATALYIGAENGHEAVMRALLDSGAVVNQAVDDGTTPLSVSMTPVFNVAQGGYAAIVQLLRDAGAV